MALTDTERDRLKVWSAGVMGWRKEQASDNWPDLVGWMCWFDGSLPKMRVPDWERRAAYCEERAREKGK